MANLEDVGRGSTKKPGGISLKIGRPALGHGAVVRWLPAFAALGLLALWEGLSRSGGLSSLFFPAPSVVLSAIVRLLFNGELIGHTGATLSRVFFGFLIGGLPGLLLGLLMGWSTRLRLVVDPLVAATHPIPKLAILPIVMIIFGIGETSKLVIIALTVFFPMLINAMAGARQISPIHFEVASNYGAGPLKVFWRVVVPGSLPFALAGARLALNIGLLLAIAVEMVSVQKGLGSMVWFAWQTLRTEELYASVFVTAALGVGFNTILQRLTAYLVPWQAENGK